MIVVVLWQFGATWRAKAALSREDSYHTLAEAAVRSQENTERQLAELTARLANVERILEQVE